MIQGTIIKVSGPLVVAGGMREANMFDVVRVGKARLIGEIIEMRGDRASIQVYEETAGIGPGDIVESTGEPLSVELGPGLVTGIYDGIERPLEKLYEMAGTNLPKGVDCPALSRETKWHFVPTAKPGEKCEPGSILGYVDETEVVRHKIMVPPKMAGTLVELNEGDYTVTDKIGTLRTDKGEEVKLTLMQKWPVRVARPFDKKLPPYEPLITGQRTIDGMFPIAKGGTACIPGPFGSGKTVTQHQLAKYSDVDLVVYIGCGERGNEMTQVLSEFSELIDPKTGNPLLDRTVLIANTSNMPVAAREASIYTGITLAEYYRDMGYDTAIMADSTSRWAEALREISGRLEEMPADEGFPAYLPSRLAEFYERAGRVETLSGKGGSVSIIGAVSPQGSDFSEPVTQNTKRFIRCFWALDKNLAYARHFPAINWNDSYSEYVPDFSAWYRENVDPMFLTLREELCAVLMEENKLMEIVKLIGADVLPDDQKLVIEVAHVIRAGFLQQEYFGKNDAFVPLKKQFAMMKVILQYYHKMRDAVALQIPMSALLKLGFSEKLIAMKHDVPVDDLSLIDSYAAEIDAKIGTLIAERGDRA